MLCVILSGVAGAPDAAHARRDGVAAPARLLITLHDGAQLDALAPLIVAGELRVERSLVQIGVHALSVPSGGAAAALAALRLHPAVDEVESDQVLSAVETRPNDDYWSNQWGVRLAGFASAWDVTRGTQKTRIAVIDSGVERSHPDLAEVLPGKDLLGDDSAPADDNGHGTAVAGIIAAVGDNRKGVAGACWECALMPVKVLGPDGSAHSADVAAGILWAVDHGARVINLSLGASRGTIALRRAAAYADRHDVVVVAAAGNAGATAHFFPAAYESVISVAASDPADRLYDWSNRGDWVDLAAPGCNLTLRRGGGYGGLCGTSAAAPLVAGLAALVRSEVPTATAAETERILLRAVTRIGPGVKHGRLDAAHAFPPPRLATGPASSSRVSRRLTIGDHVRRLSRQIRRRP